MLWPDGPVMSAAGIVEALIRIARQAERSGVGTKLRALAGEVRGVLARNPRQSSPEFLARLAGVERSAIALERQVPGFRRVGAQASEELARGIGSLPLNVPGMLPSTREAFIRFGASGERQALAIGNAQADRVARQMLASGLGSRLGSLQSTSALDIQTRAINNWLEIADQNVRPMEEQMVDALAFGGLDVGANARLQEILLSTDSLMESATLRAITMPIRPPVNDIVAESAARILPSEAITRDAYQFFSPNIEDLTFVQATQRLTSSDQARLGAISRDVDAQLGLTVDQQPAIGDWVDGAENTFFARVFDPPDFETVRYSAAWKGLLANQKSVIPFVAEAGGTDSLYIVNLATRDLGSIRAQLDEVGIQFRTLVPMVDGTRVVVFDPGGELVSNINRFGNLNGRPVAKIPGRGEFLGGETRADGRRAFRAAIQEFEARPGSRRFRPLPGPGVPGLGLQEAAAIRAPPVTARPRVTPAPPSPSEISARREAVKALSLEEVLRRPQIVERAP